MYKHFRLTYYFLFLILFSNLRSFAVTDTAHVIKYDTTRIKIIVPSKIQEETVFNGVDLGFAKQKETEDISLWDRFWNWLLELIFGKADYGDKVLMQRIFIWVFVIAGLAIVVWLFTRSEFSSFLRGNTKENAFNFSDVDEDFSEINFDERVKNAVADNDYRLAVRWLYLKQLYVLNETNHIQWQPHKTNIDYTNELSKSKHKTSFIEISKIYDYVWYGKYSINAIKYKELEQAFHQFEKQIRV